MFKRSSDLEGPLQVTMLPQNNMMPFGNGPVYRPLLLETIYRGLWAFCVKRLKKTSLSITVGSVISFLDRALHVTQERIFST